MTDAERYVRERCPGARVTSWDGITVFVNSGPAIMSNTVNLGVGDTEIEASAHAANRMEKKVQDLDSGRKS